VGVLQLRRNRKHHIFPFYPHTFVHLIFSDVTADLNSDEDGEVSSEELVVDTASTGDSSLETVVPNRPGTSSVNVPPDTKDIAANLLNVTNTDSTTTPDIMVTGNTTFPAIASTHSTVGNLTVNVLTEVSTIAKPLPAADTEMTDVGVAAESNDPAWMAEALQYLLAVDGQGEEWEKLVHRWAKMERDLNHPDGTVSKFEPECQSCGLCLV
jgi:hypothetical protein